VAFKLSVAKWAFMLSVRMLNVIILSVRMLNAIMLSVLSVRMLNAIMLSVYVECCSCQNVTFFSIVPFCPVGALIPGNPF